MTTASVKLTKNRGLMFYAVSILSPSHQDDNFDASIEAFKDIVHPETRQPNLVVHITDDIYAFNFMAEDPELTYEEARQRARDIGTEWARRHLTCLTRKIGYYPPVFRWSRWQERHAEEYQEVLDGLRQIYSGEDEVTRVFRNLVDEDIEKFVVRAAGCQDEQGTLTRKSRIRAMSLQFVLHEACGYIIIGRHIVNEYMDLMRRTTPKRAAIIDGHGGLMDGAFRMYPGGQLKCIEWLQRNRKNLPQCLWGSEGVTPIKIELEHLPIGERHTLMTPEELLVEHEFERLIARRDNSNRLLT